MKFSIEQGVAVDPDRAIAAYADPAFYEGRPSRGNISVTEVVRHEVTGPRVLLEVHFKFTGSVSSAVRAVIDPDKMTWITRSELQLDEHRSSWQILPDHYPDRVQGSGTYRFRPGQEGPESTVVKLEGDLKVHAFLVAGTVERVIVSGLRSYFTAEVKGIPDLPRPAG